MKLTKKMQEYYLQEKFFKENGTYYFSASNTDDDEDVESIDGIGCLLFIFTSVTIFVIIILSIIKLFV